jgi:hypothetical protein
MHILFTLTLPFTQRNFNEINFSRILVFSICMHILGTLTRSFT